MDKKKDNLWWKQAVLTFGNISGWIIGPIIIALFVGKYLDKRYGSAPWFFLGLTGLAFLVSIIGIWKILKKYLAEIEKEAKQKKQLENKEKNGNTDRI